MAWLGKFLREPLVHFLALGAGLFVLFGIAGDRAGDRSDRIVVSAGDVKRLAAAWQRTWQRPPTARELEGLIEDYLREEVYYREALAMGLDRDDTIIRRRLRQKMEFLAQDLAVEVEPTEAELRAFLAEHPDRFRVEARLSFSHVYLNRDRRGAAAPRDAARLLGHLDGNNGRIDAAAFGDPFPLPHDYEAASAREVARLFGGAFAARLMELPPGRWAGPVESGYGLHLVLVRARSEPRTPELGEVRKAVRREWLAARRRETNEAVYGQLRERYEVVVERSEDARGQAHAGPRR